jgi:tricarballylate dehydrogenase
MLSGSFDVVVIGAGNAALCSALSAAEGGASVLVLERAPASENGGNSRFTAGAIRCAYNGVDDLQRLIPDLTDEEVAQTDFGRYSEDNFFDDMARVTENRTDPDMVELLVRRSFETLLWMRGKGIRFAPIYGRQAFKINGKFKFWGGLTVEAVGGGPGLIDGLSAAARRAGISIIYGARAVALVTDDAGVRGVTVKYVPCLPKQSFWRPEASNLMLNGEPAISALGGTSPRCAVPASTPEMGSAWRSRPAHYLGEIGRDATQLDGTATRLHSAI